MSNIYLYEEAYSLLHYNLLFCLWLYVFLKIRDTIRHNKHSGLFYVLLGNGIYFFSNSFRSWLVFIFSGGDFDVMFIPTEDVSEKTYSVFCVYLPKLLSLIASIIVIIGLLKLWKKEKLRRC